MPTINKQTIKKGRDAVDAYRSAHAALYSGKYLARSIPKLHTPLLEQMLKDLSKAGFNSMQEFWDTNDELNVQEGLVNPDGTLSEGAWQ